MTGQQPTFLTDFTAASSNAGTAEQIYQAQIGVLQKWLFTNPDAMFSTLRAEAPVFVPGGLAPAIVSRFDDVVEVAELDSVYSVKPYSIAMKRDNGGPNFILGLDDSPEFDFNLSVLMLAVQRKDLDRVRDIVRKHARARIQAATSGQLDVVKDYGRPVPLSFIGDYFGVPGPDLATLGRWTRAIFTDIFFNFAQDAAVVEGGTRAGKDMADYVDQLIRDIKAGKATPPEDTVIQRLIAMQRSPETSCTDLGIRVNLTGCMNGVTDNTEAAIVNVLDQLFSRADALAGAIDAARSDQDDALTRYAFEALRFAPAAPFLVRVAVRDHILAKGTSRATVIPAGKLVLAATCSAMRDEIAIDQPDAFRIDRPSFENLQFGRGVHSCLGKHISRVQLTQLLKELLVLKNLRRAPGAAGTPYRNGPFPESFNVRFDC